MVAISKFVGFSPYLMFDGTNAADIVATFNNPSYTGYTLGCTASLTSQTGSTAVFHFTNTDLGDGAKGTTDVTLNATDYLTLNGWPNAVSATNLTFGNTAITSAGTARYGGYGEAILGALAVGSQNIAVTIKPGQPDTGYVASAFLDGPALALGTVSLGTPVKTSASVVTVPVINAGLLPVTLSSSTVSVNVTAPQS